NNPTFLEPFNSGRPQYLASVQQLTNQAQSSDFSNTAAPLAQVEQRANDWYNHYAQVQVKNMQSGNLATARSERTVATGKNLFDRFRAAVAQLQQASDHDLTNIQVRVNTISWVAFGAAFLLSLIAIVILWSTFTRFVNALREQLNVLKDTTNLLGEGDLTVR